MKLFAVGIAGSVLYLCSFAGSAVAQDKGYIGEILDSNCAKTGSHETMLKKEGMGDMDANDVRTKQICTNNCVNKMGAKYALYTRSKGSLQLNDQVKAAQFAGLKVRITGTVDRASKKIRVTDMKEEAY